MPSSTLPATRPLNERELAILRGFFESRVMTAAHVSSLHYESRAEAAKKALQKLKAAGLIAERPRNPFEPAVLYLTVRGLAPLRDQGILAEYPRFSLPSLAKRAIVSPRTLPHELDVMDVKTAMSKAVSNTKTFSVAEFTTWPLLNQFVIARETVKPDGFIRIHQNEADGALSEHCFFLEVDRSTEPQAVLGSRATSYLEYYKSGGFAMRNGADRSAFKDFPFRVLYVLKSEERRNNTTETLLRLNPPILTHVWLTTIEEITTNPLGAIWIRPVDYRDAVADSQFNPERTAPTFGYQRQTAREQFVKSKIGKRALLET